MQCRLLGAAFFISLLGCFMSSLTTLAADDVVLRVQDIYRLDQLRTFVVENRSSGSLYLWPSYHSAVSHELDVLSLSSSGAERKLNVIDKKAWLICNHEHDRHALVEVPARQSVEVQWTGDSYGDDSALDKPTREHGRFRIRLFYTRNPNLRGSLDHSTTSRNFEVQGDDVQILLDKPKYQVGEKIGFTIKNVGTKTAYAVSMPPGSALSVWGGAVPIQNGKESFEGLTLINIPVLLPDNKLNPACQLKPLAPNESLRASWNGEAFVETKRVPGIVSQKQKGTFRLEVFLFSSSESTARTIVFSAPFEIVRPAS